MTDTVTRFDSADHFSDEPHESKRPRSMPTDQPKKLPQQEDNDRIAKSNRPAMPGRRPLFGI